MTKDELVGKLRELVMDREAWLAAVHGIFQARVLEWGAIAFSCPYLPILCSKVSEK